jgi:UDP-N-acetylglucosamine 1-carboxyvinyltransferase
MSAAAITGGSLTLKSVDVSHLTAVVSSFTSMGCSVTTNEDSLSISAPRRLTRISSVRSSVYPGFPTDAGPLLIASLIKAEGTSVFTENIFENRFNYIGELKRLGADIKVFNKVAVIEGVKFLQSAYLSCTDLRGGAAAAVALLGSEGVGVLDNIHHIERGYENFEEVLSGISAKIVKE